MVSGSLRSLLGILHGKDFSGQVLSDLKNMRVQGLLPANGNQLFFPAPQDAVRSAQSPDRFLRAKPLLGELPSGSGADWPHGSITPVGLSSGQAAENFKPETVPAWWSVDAFSAWMTTECDHAMINGNNYSYLLKPVTEERTHLAIDARTGTAKDGEIFVSAGISLDRMPRFNWEKPNFDGYLPMTLAASVETDVGWIRQAVLGLDSLAPLGGERRLAHWKHMEILGGLWKCPQSVSRRLAQPATKQIRMVLASPGIFTQGWRPGWLNANNGVLEGTIPGTSVRVQLVGASIGRWRAVSGWCYESDKPKAIKRTVPAGGVYFFKLIDGSAGDLAGRWLRSVCDSEQDARDGFGMATWGTW